MKRTLNNQTNKTVCVQLVRCDQSLQKCYLHPLLIWNFAVAAELKERRRWLSETFGWNVPLIHFYQSRSRSRGVWAGSPSCTCPGATCPPCAWRTPPPSSAGAAASPPEGRRTADRARWSGAACPCGSEQNQTKTRRQEIRVWWKCHKSKRGSSSVCVDGDETQGLNKKRRDVLVSTRVQVRFYFFPGKFFYTWKSEQTQSHAGV